MATLTATLDSFDPATGELVGSVPVTGTEQIPSTVSRAQGAQVPWRRIKIEERASLLEKAGKQLEAEAEKLGRLLTREMGKPLKEGVGEVSACGRGMSGLVRGIQQALAEEVVEDSRTKTWLSYDPLGVCAAITPWNFPMSMPQSLVVPALMAGNTVILKPSEETPLIAQAYVDVLNRTLPEDVLQIVHGADEQGKTLVNSDVDLIAFTGSRETGKKILKNAAPGLKRVILELGGKDPMIVLKDADLKAAADFAAMNSFRNAGQVCVSTERVYVDSAVSGEFESLLAEAAQTFTTGNGLDENTKVGPMINDHQRQHVLSHIRDAVEKGAQVVAGGTEHPERFVRPTVLSNVNDQMPIMIEETFGPVACVTTFADPQEAIDRANNTPFGLGAVVFGKPDSALEVARQLEAGMVGVNKSCGGAAGSPWVGAKESGYGFHSSKAGHRQFTQTRIVSAPKA